MHSSIAALLAADGSKRQTFTRYYRSRDNRHEFHFRIVPSGDHYEIYCLEHPSLNGQSDSPRKTHLFESGKVCLVSGKEPTSTTRALELAAQWAEYFLEYRRTGIAQE